MADETFDLVVIGAGPGGYVAAIRAAQLGLRVACVEKEARLGGTCLRIGCIPSKALLDASERYAFARHKFADIGLACDNLRVDLPAMMRRKDKVVETLTSGVAFLLKKNKITTIAGSASFTSPTELAVRNAAGETRAVHGRRFLIATGSAPIELPALPFNGKTIINSDQALSLDHIPERMVVVGAGAIGLELGSVYSRLGSRVTVLEMHHTTLPGSDDEMGHLMERTLKQQHMSFYFNTQATGAREIDGKLHVEFVSDDSAGGGPKEKRWQEQAGVILVAVGRRPYTEGLGSREVGVAYDNRNRIVVNERFETNVPGIFAIGDVIAGAMLAHKAEEEGIAAAEFMAGKAGHVNYNALPAVVYTAPELAWVGQTEERARENARESGGDIAIGKFKFSTNGRALCMDEAEGLVKIIADAKTDRVLGVHILGPQASSLIAEAALAMAFGASSEDIARTCHAHPTLPEAVMEAAMAVEKRSIHS